ncbi:MAG: peptidase M14 [Elusimicrobia bacterium]|nr:peptidase M14 [Elusimicrobiota bacterium]
MLKTSLRIVAAAALAASPASAAKNAKPARPKGDRLSTVAEKSGWIQTGRYEEVVRLCAEYPKAYPGKVRCAKFATTPEGRPMIAFVASAAGAFEPGEARKKKLPVVFVQGGIHAGEIDGKDAGFLAMRELLDDASKKGVLSKTVLVFVPVFNVDGHERFGAHNRPNQRGPEETGWRTTAQNLNLNRDYAKAEAPEMAAMLELLNKWDPIVYADLHVTDGAKFQQDMGISLHPSAAGPARMAAAGQKLLDGLVETLNAGGHRALPFYPAFIKDDEPSSGVRQGASTPRFSQCYWGTRNRIGVLVEIHSWIDYLGRVKADQDFIMALTEAAARDGAAWVAAAAAQDAEDAAASDEEVALTFSATDKSRTIEFQGYAYTRSTSSISGQLWTSYDETKPEVWKIPYFYELQPKLKVKPPKAGYLVPLAYARLVGDKLRLHGIRYETLRSGHEAVTVETFRAQKAETSKESFEGRATLSVQGAWSSEPRNVAAGSLFVPIAQPRRRLLLHLLEPAAPDSLLSWGFFNAAFERKEYMEPYVTESVAREMMADFPEVKAEFEKKLKDDPEFAKSPDKRLDFFYQRHPSWDERYNLYPVFRLEQPL